MMALLLEYWLPIAIIVGTFIGSILGPLRGYKGKPKNGGSTLHGAAIMDSSIGQEIVVALNRMAQSAENIEKQLQDTADSEAEDRKIRAAIEAAKVKWEREQRGT